MKLIFCKNCHDIVKLTKKLRKCECGKSWGQYLPNGLDARIDGEAIPLGIANGSFVKAIKNQDDFISIRFDAFVIEKCCPTVWFHPNTEKLKWREKNED